MSPIMSYILTDGAYGEAKAQVKKGQPVKPLLFELGRPEGESYGEKESSDFTESAEFCMEGTINAYLVLVLGVLIGLFWLGLLLWPAWNTLKKWNQLKSISKHGVPVYGEIASSQYLRTPSPGKPAPIEIQVEFKNFSGSTIQHQFRFMDTRPEERRYEKGKSVPLKCMENPQPTVILAEGKAAFRPLFWIIWFSVLAGSCYGIYFLLSPFLQTVEGWDSLLLSLAAIEVMPMLTALGIGAVITLVVIGSFLRSFSAGNGNRLKFYGVLTEATIQSRKETGVYVNRQPQIEYHYRFRDRNGAEHNGSDREVISLLDIAEAGQVTSRQIMYLPDFPSVSSFVSNITEPSGTRILLKVVLIFVFLVFSFVMGGNIISQLR